MQAFCFQENQLLCIDCVINDHKQHRIKTLEESAASIMNKVSFAIEEANEVKSNPQKYLTEIEKEYS